MVHASPSLQSVPSPFAVFSQRPLEGTHSAVRQGSPVFAQTTIESGKIPHVPSMQPTSPLHALLSSRSEQSEAVSHSSQLFSPGTHTPSVHESAIVHVMPSSHDVPSARGAIAQAPVSGLQRLTSQIPTSSEGQLMMVAGSTSQAPSMQ